MGNSMGNSKDVSRSDPNISQIAQKVKARTVESFHEVLKILNTLIKSKLFWISLLLIVTGVGILITVPYLLCVTGKWISVALVIPGYFCIYLGNALFIASAVRAVIVQYLARRAKKSEISYTGYV